MRYRVRLTLADGTSLLWHKGGREHSLDERLGPMWVQNFKSALFQVLADGQVVPRGAADASDIVKWDLEPIEG